MSKSDTQVANEIARRRRLEREVEESRTFSMDVHLFVTAHVPIERDTGPEVAIRLREESGDGNPMATLFIAAAGADWFPVGSRVRFRCDTA